MNKIKLYSRLFFCMTKYIFFVINFVFFLSINCSRESEVSKNNFQLFIENLEEKQTKTSSFIKENVANVHGYHKLIVDRDGQVIVVDDSNWSVHLFSKAGELITTVGGKGEGPGEFMAINDLFMSSDNNLYILDKRLQKISSFSINYNRIEYQDSYALPNYSPLVMQAFYYTEPKGYIGVFHELRPEAGKRTPFLVYKLNHDLEIEEKLFEIPGNETILLRNIAVVDSPVGFRSFWQIVEGSFYYAHSDDLSFTSINMKTHEANTVTLDDNIPTQSMTHDYYNFLVEHFEMMVRSYTEAEEAIREREFLPYFRNFFVGDTYVFFDIYPDNHDQAYVLGFDRHSRNLFTVRVPNWFTVSGFTDNKIIGLVGSGVLDEVNDILVIEF